jgi:hypothetical protein
MYVKIKGDRWKCFVYDHEDFVERFGEGMSAFTDPPRKQIFFVAEDLDMQIVRHEIFHAFTTYLCLDSVALEPEQLEEIYCEMFGKDGPKMMDLSAKILKRLRGLE